MKRNLLLVLLIPFFFIGCGDKDEEDKDVLSLNATSCILTEKAYYKLIDVKNGSGKYIAEFSEPSIVDAFVCNDRILLIAIKAGKSLVSIVDSNGKKAVIDVTVNGIIPMRTLEGNVWGKNGNSYMLSIDGRFLDGDIYLKANSNEIANFSWDGNKIEMKALREGNTGMLILNGSELSDEYEIRIYDKFELHLSISNGMPSKILYTKTNEDFNFTISSGNGGYQVKLDDPSMATLIDIIDVDTRNMFVNQAKVSMKALVRGETNIIVTDTEGLSESIPLVIL